MGVGIDPFRMEVLERTTPRYYATLVDNTTGQQVLSAANLTTITLTLYDKKTGNILNGRNKQNVLNTNNVTIDSAGQLVWELQPADLAIVNTNNTNESHIALFEWSWSQGTKFGKREVDVAIRNLTNVP